jgi:hypothetical protein
MSDEQQTFQIKIVEWEQWFPMEQSPIHQKLAYAKGVTGFTTSKKDKLLEVHVSGTGLNKSWGEGEGLNKFGLYAFQAVLVNSETDSESLMKAVSEQTRPLMDRISKEKAAASDGRDKSEDLIVTDSRGNPMPKPNRKQRRGG